MTLAAPGYAPEDHGIGIVHLGLGAFHRAHQAAITDAALAASGGDWRILGVSLRSAGPAEALTAQGGRYTLIERGPDGAHARVIGAIAAAVGGPGAAAQALAAMGDPGVKIVSLTITEKGYGLDRARRGCDPSHPSVAADLASPEAPTGALGLIVAALGARRAAGTPPFTVLCCDNLPDNGALVKGALVDFAGRLDPALAAWIEATLACPATMVDRITPPSDARTYADAERLTGRPDPAAIETEPFVQWVIEDHFPLGRPAWEAGGAVFVADVAPYEAMKLRMLNGAHSMMAYAGALAGCKYVRDVMQDPALTALVRRHMEAAARTLPPLPGVDLAEYADALVARFANPAIAHQTRHIAMDGTEKLPQRILIPAMAALAAGRPIRPFAFAAAAWMRWAMGTEDDGAPHPLNDPREDAIAARLAGLTEAPAIADALMGMTDVFPPALAGDPVWRAEVTDALTAMLALGMAGAIEAEAR